MWMAVDSTGLNSAPYHKFIYRNKPFLVMEKHVEIIIEPDQTKFKNKVGAMLNRKDIKILKTDYQMLSEDYLMCVLEYSTA